MLLIFATLQAWGADLPELVPLRSPDEARWHRSDRNAMVQGRLGTGGLLVGIGLTLGGAALLPRDPDLALPMGSAGVLVSLVSAPVLLGGSRRSARSLRERGIRVRTLPVTLGWSLIHLYLLTPAFTDDALLAFSGVSAALVGLGTVQFLVNRRGRITSRLVPLPEGRGLSVGIHLVPRPRGFALVGTF